MRLWFRQDQPAERPLRAQTIREAALAELKSDNRWSHMQPGDRLARLKVFPAGKVVDDQLRQLLASDAITWLVSTSDAQGDDSTLSAELASGASMLNPPTGTIW